MSELQFWKKIKKDIESKIAEIESSQAPVTPVKWNPKGGNYTINVNGIPYYVPSTQDSKIFGFERETREQAEHAAEWMRKFNRLMCWFEENAPGHEMDIVFDLSNEVSIRFYADCKIIDDLRTKIRDGVVEL